MGKPNWMIEDEKAEQARMEMIRAKKKARNFLPFPTEQEDDAKREQAVLDHMEGEQFFLP